MVVCGHTHKGFKLGRIDAIIKDDLEKKLRMKAVELYGGKKGSLTAALEAAIDKWVNEQAEVKKNVHR